MPKYQIYYQWTCPRCGNYNSKGYHCAKCFYAPNVPKQRFSAIAVALAVGSVLLVILGGWLMLAKVTVLGGTFVLLGGLMAWAAAKW